MKRIVHLLISIVLLASVTACGETENTKVIKTVKNSEITLNFSYGTRKGLYSGEINDEGIPNGTGTFESENESGISWTYVGDWNNGHWDGKGISTYSSGEKYEGEYVNDVENGQGDYHFASGSEYIGNFVDGKAVGQGKLYYMDNKTKRCFIGEFTDFNNGNGYVLYNDGSKRAASLRGGELSFTEESEPKIGMTENEVLSSTWGNPKKKNKTTTVTGTTEQWVYENGYITFSDGIVISIQEVE